jgi:hypothetical protein
MSIRHSIWRVSANPQPLVPTSLPSEALLEEMIVAAPDILSSDWMLIGRQEPTSAGGRIDLLALAPDASLVLIEIKRDRTPREVVAQALDYACWVEGLDQDNIASIYARYAPGRSLSNDFRARFQRELDESELNQSHQLVIVAGSLDPSSERIVGYLNERGIAINVVCFQVFEHGEEKLLSRAWLLDPVETQSASAAPTRNREPSENWIGEYYASFGPATSRSWQEAQKYGFISAGGGAWYSRTLNLPDPGDRIWVKSPEHGFVGVGRVAGAVQPMSSFEIDTEEGPRPAAEVLRGAHYHRQFIDDPEKCEYFLPVEWIETVPLDRAVREVGLFGNQNTVCAPRTQRWRHTVERLKQAFPHWEG